MSVFSTPLFALVCIQASFVVIGKLFLAFSVSWESIVLTLVIAHLADFVLVNRRELLSRTRPKWVWSWSVTAAALGIILFFRAVNPWYFVLAAFLAVVSKYVITRNGAHLFNPSNFAIVLSVFFFTSSATIEMTQWGTSTSLHVFMAAACFAVAYWAGVLRTTLSFLFTYSALLAIATLYMPQLFMIHHFGILNPSLVLFSSFMITDPKTSPRGRYERMFHGAGVAALYFFLEALGVRYALFVSSFLTTILNLISRELLAFWERYVDAVKSIVRNAPTFLLSCVLCAAMLGAIMFTQNPKPNSWPMSLNFLLNGTESGTAACFADPVFKKSPALPILPPGQTEGASWGDYDNDGWDDLFIARRGSPSVLLHNDKGRLVDRTEESGLSSVRYATSGHFIDYDGDGLLDLIVTPSLEEGEQLLRSFRNVGSGRFVETTLQSKLGVSRFPYSYGTLTAADYDRDGDIDIFASEYGEVLSVYTDRNSALLKSFFDPRYRQTGWFVCDASEVQRLLPSVEAFIQDKDADMLERFKQHEGCLIVRFEVNRLSWSNDPTTMPTHTRIVSATLVTPGYVHLFENREGVFTEVPEFTKDMRALLAMPPASRVTVAEKVAYITGMYLQPVSYDYNDDGYPDIFISVDTASNILLRNDGNMRFSDVTAEMGLNYAGTGMGVDIADVDGDGVDDLFVNNVREDYLYLRRGEVYEKLFNPEFARVGIGWGTAFLDYNLDGWNDLYVTNGDVQETFGNPLTIIARPYFRSDNLFKNNNGILEDVTGKALCPDRDSGRALAVSDFDNDGDPDIFIGNYHSPDYLLENTVVEKSWVAVELEGRTPNTMGIGARVTIRADGREQHRQILVSSSFFSQNSQRLLFGLAEYEGPVDVEVRWLSGRRSLLEGVSSGEMYTIREH